MTDSNLNLKVGIFKVYFVKGRKRFQFITEYKTTKKKEVADYLEHKKKFSDFNYYFCTVKESESYYYFTSSKKIKILEKR
jgi:hypothetical protein